MTGMLCLAGIMALVAVFWAIQRRKESLKASERRRVIRELYKQLESEL